MSGVVAVASVLVDAGRKRALDWSFFFSHSS